MPTSCGGGGTVGIGQQSSGSRPPEILEPIRGQGGIDRRRCNRPMPEPSLNCPGVVPLVGERIAAGMAKHMGVRLQFEAGASGRTLDHPGEARGRERRAALADENEWRRLCLTLFSFAMDAAGEPSERCRLATHHA